MSKPADRSFPLARAWAPVALAGLVLAAQPGCTAARNFSERAASSVGRITGSNYDDPVAESKLQEAEELYKNGQYAKAEEAFCALADNKGNSAVLAERARFQQAECRFALQQYPKACDTYHRVLNDFPNGAYRRDCCDRMLFICEFWLEDFKKELQARSGEQGVLHWHPKVPEFGDPRKPTFDQEGRALEGPQRVHMHDVTGPKADQALFWCGYVNFIRGNFTEADHFLSQLVDMHPDSQLRPQAMALAVLAKNNATGGAVYDGRKCAEALQLIQIAEATVPEVANDEKMSAQLTRAKFAIRTQQAEKDFLMADYYERTGHPGSAVFYFELVRRRYAGTKYAELATERQARLIQLLKEGHPDPGIDPLAVAKAKFNGAFNVKKSAEEKDRLRDPNVTPAGGPVPQQGIAGGQVPPPGAAGAPNP
jgi:outer membrane protein assembly factor BamD (BamD/ComL family)